MPSRISIGSAPKKSRGQQNLKDDKQQVARYGMVGFALFATGIFLWIRHGYGKGILMIVGMSIMALAGCAYFFLLRDENEGKRQKGGARKEPSGPSVVIPQGTKCYECLQDPAQSQCASCKMVFYCGDTCQKKAWRHGHKSLCKAVAAAAARPLPKLRKLQGKSIEAYQILIRHLLDPYGPQPLDPVALTRVLHSMGAFIRNHAELMSQEVADSLWALAAAQGEQDKQKSLCAVWGWVVLEECLQAGSVDTFLGALGLERFSDKPVDGSKLLKWVNEDLGQALLMVLKTKFSAKMSLG